MIVKWRRIGDHLTRFRIADAEADRYLQMTIGDCFASEYDGPVPDLSVNVRSGFGMPYLGEEPPEVKRDEAWVYFARSDYRLTLSADCREADIRFYDYFGLRTALLNWYSTVITRSGWGVIVHSCCVVQDGKAFLFAGMSGAGKSTVAFLSRPRMLLADETALVRVPEGEPVQIHDSPFRNEFKEPADKSPIPLHAVYLLKQSPVIRAQRLSGSEALLALLNKIVHWPYDAAESSRLIRMSKRLIESVTVCELEFQKNDLFWEAIS